jgi:hypothetical protein
MDECKGYSSLSVSRPDGDSGVVAGHESSGGLRRTKMKKISIYVGTFFWLLGFGWIAFIMREVLSKTAGYTSLVMLIGPLIFHTLCMIIGGFFFKKGVQKAPLSPAAG